MIHECINLKTIYPQLHGGDSVLLTSYCLDNFEEWNLHEKRKTILILPGGGYQFVSQREAAVSYTHLTLPTILLV